MQEIEFLEQRYFGNSIRDFAICIGIILVGFLFKRFGATFLSRQSFRLFKRFSSNQKSDQLVLLIRKPLEQSLTLIILFIGFNSLTFPDAWHIKPLEEIGLRMFLHRLWMVAIFVTGTRILLRATDYFAHILSHREELPVSYELANFMKELIKVLLVIFSFFAGLHFIFDANITALVASLGIGGLAVALAAQDTLANLLGSFIIYLDKPFRAGDTIETNDIKGVVEHVGFRTTRIRTAEKSLLTVPNKKLIDSALNNITLSDARRVRFVLSLTYETSSAQLQAIITDIKNAINEHPKTSNDYTVKFDAFENSSLNVLIIYFVQSNDADLMSEVKEEINFSIMQIIEQNKSSFAFPSQRVFLQQ